MVHTLSEYVSSVKAKVMVEDSYKTIEGLSESIYTEKRSKFIAIALPVRTLEEIKTYLDEYQKKYYDARHVCYAYMLGAERKDFRANDNGEPSGTAGKPILGQINSKELTECTGNCGALFWGNQIGNQRTDRGVSYCCRSSFG